LDQAVGYCFHYFESGYWLLFQRFCISLLVTVPVILDQAVGYFYIIMGHAVGCCSHYLGSFMLLVTVTIILDQAVDYCSHYFGSGWWLLFPLFWVRLLVTVPIILDQVVCYCSGDFGSCC
jgi:hypothetical protein